MKMKELAQREGISVQRAARLARDGRVHATKVDGKWVVDSSSPVSKRSRRPLSPQSRADFLHFLDKATLDGITGSRKKRAGERVRTFIAAEDPATLLREWWAGGPAPEGRGFAVLVRLALDGRDSVLIHDRQKGLGGWILDNPHDIAGRVSDWRAIRGTSVQELSELTGVSESHIRTIERTGYSPGGNRDVARVVQRLKVPAVRVHSKRGKDD